MRTFGLAVMLTVSTLVACAADQTPPTYHTDIWSKLTPLAQQAQQQGAIPTDANGQPITDLQSLVKRYQGRYASPTDRYHVFAQGGQLRVKREGDLSKLLRLQKDGQFAPWRLMRGRIPVQYDETKQVRYAFMTLDGRDVLVVHENGAVRWAAEKVTNSEISMAWKRRTGTYLVNGLPPDAPMKAEIAMREDYGMLWLTGTLTSGEKVIAPLVPVTETEYRIGGLGHRTGESLHANAAHGQETLRLGTWTLLRK